VLIKGQVACRIVVGISSALGVMFPASSIDLRTSSDVIGRKLILRVTVIRQVSEMSLAFIEFVSNSETSKLLFSSRDLTGGFRGVVGP
jgi:hypothetical protein